MPALSRVPSGPRARLRARSRPISHFSRLRLEALEERQLLSITPQVLMGGTGAPSKPVVLSQVGDVFFFSATDGTNGYELWKTDGTTAGTVLVKDIRPGADSSVVGSYRNSIALDGALLFFANDGAHGQELWRSDGTSAGTVMVKDIRPGDGGSGPKLLVNVGGTLFFTANDGTTGYELWRTDGTNDGTVLVKDIRPGSSDAGIFGLTNVNGTLFFAANDGTSGSELWKSDGTETGTVLVSDINPGTGGVGPENLTNVAGTLYFRADDGVHGTELWKTDGTAANTVLVRDVAVGTASSVPNSLVNVGGTLFFQANDGTSANELWKSDGSSAGTVLVKSISPTASAFGPGFLTNVNNRLFFSANDGTHGFELWTSDGTSDGTVLAKDIRSGAVSGLVTELMNVDGTLFFTARDADHGTEFWTSDGTSEGTVLVKDVFPGASPGASNGFRTMLGSLGASAILALNDGTHGVELWKSDGTSDGTVLLKDINLHGAVTPVTGGSVTRNGGTPYLTDVSGTAFFTAYDSVHGIELWKSDGTDAGTEMVKDITPGSPGQGNDANTVLLASSDPKFLTNVNGTLYFVTKNDSTQCALWKSDGTTEGTELVRSIGAASRTRVYSLLNANGTLYFVAGSQLWKSDGTSVGTMQVTNVKPSAFPAPVAINGMVFFDGNDDTSGDELWKTDGTPAGTVLVKDILPGSASSYPDSFMNVNGELFFTATYGSTGDALWKSDGSADGTVLVKDIRAGTDYPDAGYLMTNVNGTLFFRADDGSTGYELWKSDGTTAGTMLVKDIRPGTSDFGPVSPGSLFNANGTLYFRANDGSHGNELWKSDGTTAGTVLLKDIRPGSNDGLLRFEPWLATVGDKLFFPANDGTHGFQLWTSDGTSAGTVLATDLAPAPGYLTNLHRTLFFASEGGKFSIVRSVNLDSTAVAQPEGNSAATPVVFPVTLSLAKSDPIEVSYQTSDGTATEADGDYVGASGTLTFAPGQTVSYVTVLVNGDTDFEPNEQFYLNLIDTNDGFVATPQAVVTIVNDEHGIAGKSLFYKGSSKWNVTNGATFSDDNAIAPDKSAYLPGAATSTFANVSSYWRGINGLMVDVAGAHGPITANDFIFKIGNNNSPNTWTPAPAPTLVTTRIGAGTGGSDRVELIWADNAIQSTWLEIIVRGNDALGGSNGNTGLLASDVFFFGSALGDAGADNDGAFSVTSADEINARNNPKMFIATRSDVNDFNRDGSVSSTDQIIARNNATTLGNQLKFLVVGGGGPFAPVSSSNAAIGPPTVDAHADRGVEAVIALALTADKPMAGSTPTCNAQASSLLQNRAAADAYFERISIHGLSTRCQMSPPATAVATPFSEDATLDDLLIDLGV
jgi:ELWxxDGT repeat protein